MLDTIEHVPYRRAVFIIFALLVFATNSVEIISEFAAGEAWSTMWDDLSWFVLSALVLVLFAIEHIFQQRTLGQLRDKLKTTRGQLSQLDDRSQRITQQFRDVMQKQFDVWQLTTSEQSVVLGLLKGLSFKEIATLRDTREKTVRQQASSVYRKAGVSSRHELAAWFFEDLLEPLPEKKS